jgi:erythrocyte band 7 integral membrane protein
MAATFSTSEEKRTELFEDVHVSREEDKINPVSSPNVEGIEDVEDVEHNDPVELHQMEKFKQSFGNCLSTLLCCCGVTVDDDHHADIVEFGRYKRSVGSGMHWFNLVSESVHISRDIFVKENQVGVLSRCGVFEKVYLPGQYHQNTFLNEHIDVVELTIVPENYKGILTRNGTFVEIKDPGQHFVNKLLKEDLKIQNEIIIRPNEVGAQIINGNFVKCLKPNKYFANSILNEEIHVIKMTEVKEGYVGLLTREGKFQSVLKSGGYFPNPFLKESIHSVNMQSITDELKAQRIVTRDTTPFQIRSVLVYKVVDACKSFYAVADLDFSIREAAKTSTQQVLGEFYLDDIMTQKATLSAQIKERLALICANWGVIMERIDIRDIEFDKELAEDLSAAAKAKRLAEAKKINAEAEIEVASKMEIVSRTLASPAAMQMRALDTMKSICDNPNTRVLFIPPLGSFFSPSESSSDSHGSSDKLNSRIMERVISAETIAAGAERKS